MRPRPRSSLLLIPLLALACASPMHLARISERELAAGNVRKAYEIARRGVDKDPGSGPARWAMTAAASRLVEDWMSRVIVLADADTLAAAQDVLELRDFRLELVRYGIDVSVDSSFEATEHRLRDAAAGIYYRLGKESFASQRPKQAYAHFREAANFVSGFRDVQRMMSESRERGITRVVILPFVNHTQVPGLSKTLADQVYRAVAARLDPEDFEFTELVHPDEVYAAMTVKELEAPDLETALRVAHKIEADRLVVGRFYGLRSSTNTWSFEYPIYRKVVERDTSGGEVERYAQSRFEGLARERVVSVRWELEVLDARTRTALVTRSEPIEVAAKVAWTDFRADGDCDRFCLAPPDRRKSDPVGCGKVDARWNECFGSWSLPEFLEHAREHPSPVYDSGYLEEFRSDTRTRPVFLGELPSENDLAHLALEDVWRPVFDALRQVDKQD